MVTPYTGRDAWVALESFRFVELIVDMAGSVNRGADRKKEHGEGQRSAEQ